MGLQPIFRENYRMCPQQLACDGALLRNGREVCPACESALKKRRLPAKPLRGEQYLAYYQSRGKK